MSLELEIPTQFASNPDNLGAVSLEAAAVLIKTVIRNIQNIIFSSNAPAVVKAIDPLDPGQIRELLRKYKRSLASWGDSSNAARILTALNQSVAAE